MTTYFTDDEGREYEIPDENAKPVEEVLETGIGGDDMLSDIIDFLKSS